MNAMSYICTGRIGGRIDPDVSLVRAPWDGETATPDARPETAPARGIKGAPTLTKAEATIAAIRAMRDEMRASA